MTTNAHTPTPWEVGDLDHNGQRIVRGEHIEICTCWHHCVGSIEKEMEANAAFIVKAVNSHDALVAALPAIFHALEETLGFASLSPGARENVEFVIAELAALKATGG